MEKIRAVPNFTTESKFSTWMGKRLKEEFGDSIKIINHTATGYGSSGVSDFIICFGGLFISMELKLDGRELTKLQEKFAIDVDKAGGINMSPMTPGRAEMGIEFLHEIVKHRERRKIYQSLSPEEAAEVVAEAKQAIALEGGTVQ
jgi:hypothetical protein